MSSCKFWKERGRSNGLHPESGYRTKQRKMPPLLRLNSTGEISSAKVANSGQNPNLYETQKALSNSGNQLSLKGLFDSLKMTTVLESANAYIGSAASYLEEFCNSSSRKNTLVRSESDTTALKYLHNMSLWKDQRPVTGKDHSGSFDSVLTQDKSFVDIDSLVTSPANDTQSAKAVTATTKPVTATMPNSIFGVLQNTFSNCSTMKSKPEPYIPPPLKNRTLEGACRNRGAMFDPKLTPYNARLLARSRNQRSCAESVQQNKCQKENKPTENRSCNKFIKSNECERANSPISANSTDSNVKDTLDVQSGMETSNCDKVLDKNLSDSDTDGSDIVNDWFDYENSNIDVIPVHFNSTDSTDRPSQNSFLSCENVQPCDSPCPASPSLHNWHSVEFDVDVQKAVEDSFHSSQEDGSQNSCDNSRTVNIPQNSEKMSSESATCDSANTTPKDVKHPETKTESACVFPSILYVRNVQNSRKCRPSSKKRRRQKEKIQSADVKSTPVDKKTSSAKNQVGSVAFILGIESSNGKNASHPFLISCDTDSCSDWSDCDSDLEVDGIDGESMEGLCSLSNPFSFFNLDVMCSIQPTSPAPCSSLDAINLSWQVNFSVDSNDKPMTKKTSPSKKVRFVEDKLETVHHMFAWSYAYAAARKGPWEEIARDRGRFLRRITDGEKLLRPILDSQHRENIFQERFETDTK